MKELLRKHHISFGHAVAGIIWALHTQPNFRVHLFFASLAIILGLYVELNSYEWVLIIFTIFWALAAEMINTALESIADLVTKEWREEIKIAKDVSAGMMLLVASGTVVVGILILLPKLLLKLGL